MPSPGFERLSIAIFLATLFIASSAASAQQKLPDRKTPPAPRHREVDSLPYAPPSLRIREAPALPPVSPTAILHGPRDRKYLALTFDACSTRKPSHYDERVTQVLVETKTPATIFLGGKWMEEEPEQTKYLASLPQIELANHTFLHPHLKAMSDERVRQELRWTQEVMYSLTGRQGTLFRPPYGEYDGRIVRIAAQMGLTTIEYDLASGDPDPNIPKERLIEYVSTMAKNGSIIVMHINRRGWHTAEALPEIISRLRKRGFTLVTVSELLSHAPVPDKIKERARE
jgi:peptidoglycan/xylan/chitin deacetylase (PgdA/CDA1 family)